MSAGAQIAVHGESGSGKTTFLNLIAGIVKAGCRANRTRRRRVQALARIASATGCAPTTIGCVYQSFNLLQGYTCLENVLLAMAFGAGRDAAFAKTLLDRVGLSHRASATTRGSSRSGQQQRVAVARALANGRSWCSPTSQRAISTPALRTKCSTLLRETCAEQGAALLLVSHDREILARFERVEEFEQLNRALRR